MTSLVQYCLVRGVQHTVGGALDISRGDNARGVVNLHFAKLWFKWAGKLGVQK